MQWQVIRQVVESRCKHEDAPLAHGLLEQQWSAVLQPHAHTCPSLIHRCRVEKPHTLPLLLRACRGIRGVGRTNRRIALGLARVVMRREYVGAKDWNLSLLGGSGSQSNQDAAAASNVLQQLVSKRR